MQLRQCGLLRRAVLIAVWLVFTAPAMGADSTAESTRLAGDLNERIQLTDGWLYHPGDDPSFADPTLDDSAWEPTSSLLPLGEDPADGWNGVGWFRRRLELGSKMPATALALRPMQGGASEVYLDGRLVGRFGTVSANPDLERPVYANDFIGVALQPGRAHVLAVRYSNSRGNILSQRMRGFALNLRSVDSAAAAYHRWGLSVLTQPALFTGAFAALGLLHLLLFAFHPASRENIAFAGFALVMALQLGLEIRLNLITDLIDRLVLFRPYLALNVIGVLLGLVLVHTVTHRRPGWTTWAVGTAGVVLLVWVCTWEAFRRPTLLYVFFLIGFLEMLRVTLIAALQRGAEMWVVAVAFIPFACVAVLRMASRLSGYELPLDVWGSFSLALLGIAFSVFISRRSARTARELELRLQEVEELSARTVEQERRAAQQEAERKVLEAMNYRRGRELEEARRLQLAMLPRSALTVPGYEIAYHMLTATEVGGDYVDLKSGDGAPPLLAVGDATSHGLQAGMVVAVAKSLFQGVEPAGGPVSALMRVGEGLQAMRERHASMAMVVLQARPGLLRVASAGMPPVLVLRRDTGRIDEVLLPGVPLGTVSGASYRQEEIPVATGDTILLMTDGLAEAVGDDGEPFGYARVSDELRHLGGCTAKEVVARMLDVATSFIGERAPDDDVTLVALVVR